MQFSNNQINLTPKKDDAQMLHNTTERMLRKAAIKKSIEVEPQTPSVDNYKNKLNKNIIEAQTEEVEETPSERFSNMLFAAGQESIGPEDMDLIVKSKDWRSITESMKDFWINVLPMIKGRSNEDVSIELDNMGVPPAEQRTMPPAIEPKGYGEKW